MSRRSSRTASKDEKIKKDDPQILTSRRAKTPVKDEAVIPQPTKKVKKEKTLDTNEEKKPDDKKKKD